GIKREDVERGQVIIKPGSVTPHTEFESEGPRPEPPPSCGRCGCRGCHCWSGRPSGGAAKGLSSVEGSG
ncbi:hypothetical protein AB0D15_18830, partial [Streptomyces sp. NPDC048551]